MERIAELRRIALAQTLPVRVPASELQEICSLALSTFNDSGTSGADLDAELNAIDDALELAGYEPGNTIRAIANLCRRAVRAENRLALLTKKKPKKRKRAKR